MIYKITDDYHVRGLCESDMAGSYQSWFEDQEICRYNSHGKFIKNTEWFREFYFGLNSEDKLVWAICHKNDGHIGNVSLQSISFVNRNAEFAILIGDSNHRNKGTGFNVGMVLLQHGFLKLNLKRIYCGTASTNLGMLNLALQLGMTEEGCRRKHLFLEGEWVDMLEFGILRNEYECRLGGKT